MVNSQWPNGPQSKVAGGRMQSGVIQITPTAVKIQTPGLLTSEIKEEQMSFYRYQNQHRYDDDRYEEPKRSLMVLAHHCTLNKSHRVIHFCFTSKTRTHFPTSQLICED